MNTVNVTGRITHDPTVKVTPSNKHVMDFQIAIKEGKEDTIFIKCQAWEQNADYLEQYAMKGSMIAITGNLKVDRYKDKNDNNVEKVFVRVGRAEIMDKFKTDNQSRSVETDNQAFIDSVQGTEYANQFGATQNNLIEESDLPFY